jgi:cytochrome c553
MQGIGMEKASIRKKRIARMAMKRSTSCFVTLFSLFAGMMLAAYPPGAVAQLASAKSSDELRPLYANPEEVAEGKRVADSSCAGCHGANGVSTTVGVPHLAGQRPAYLYIELKAYQSGARGDSAMRSAVKFLNDDALIKAAAYYASLDPAQPSATNGARGRPADPVEAGKTVAASCAGCHGEAGVSKIPGMPSLVGLDPKYLITAMKAYKDGQRKELMMKSLLASISDADINNIALYYALEKPLRAQTPSPGDQAKGKAASASCAGCHGEQGVSASPANPSLAGQDAEYLAAAMRAYKDGSRSDETMKGLVASLDENAIKDMSAFYANQQPRQPSVRKPLSTEEWAQRCDRCHGLNGNSTDPRLPALAGQRLDYLEKVLNDYRTRARKKSEMTAMSDVLSEDDIKHLAAHYSRQKARAVVFVTLPSR